MTIEQPPAVVETTDHHPSWRWRFNEALNLVGVDGGGSFIVAIVMSVLAVLVALLEAPAITGRVGFATAIPVPPESAHGAHQAWLAGGLPDTRAGQLPETN